MKTMLEHVGSTAARVAAALAVGALTVHCGGDGDTDDGGTAGDGGSSMDGGDGNAPGGGGGTGGVAGGSGLCATYPEGHENRTTFGTGAADNTRNAGQNDDGFRAFLKKIEDVGGTPTVTIGFYNINSPANPPTYTGMQLMQTRSLTFPNFGSITMQVCSTEFSGTCTLSGPMGSVTGDADCTATIAADRPWGP